MAMSPQLVIDCREPERLVDFWQPLLGYEVPPPPSPHTTWREYYLSVGESPDGIVGDGKDRLRPADGQGIPIWFQTVPEPKTVKNRLHLDLRVSSGRTLSRQQRRTAIETVVAGVEARGGRVVRWSEDEASDHVCAVMADSEGNEFCLV